METARDIMDRLKKSYADYPEALELIANSYDEIVTMPDQERARRLAMNAESTLAAYY